MSESEWMDIFSNNLKELLDNRNYTQRDLAVETGIHETTISRYINKQLMPGVKTLLNIAYALDCSLDDLMDFGESID